MKKLIALLTFLIFIINSSEIRAQDEDNPWQISFGTNAVDVEADTNTSINEFFNVDGSWNEEVGHGRINAYVALTQAFNASIQNIEPTSLALYPNPAGNHIYLNGAENNAQYTINDSFGRVCLRDKLSESKQIMIEELKPGIYFIKTNGQVLKFQVQN